MVIEIMAREVKVVAEFLRFCNRFSMAILLQREKGGNSLFSGNLAVVGAGWSTGLRMEQKAALSLEFGEVASWRASWPECAGRIVLTNGCFDLLHAGHVLYLEEARQCGDFLVVALNSDASVAELKGPSRPINPAADRLTVLSRLRSVDAVTIFDSLRVTEVILALRPHVYVKGGDYTEETLDPGEREALRTCNTEIHLVSLIHGRSTTSLIEKLGQPTG